MAEGVGFPFPSLPLNEGRTYGQPEVVLISLPQVATGLRYACRARSVGGTFSRTKLCTWMAATCAVALHSYAEGGLADSNAPDTAFVKLKSPMRFVYMEGAQWQYFIFPLR